MTAIAIFDRIYGRKLAHSTVDELQTVTDKELVQFMRLRSICSFPQTVLCFVNVRRLCIENCGLTRIPRDIDRMHMLHFLMLSENRLEYLPRSIGNLKYLQELDLDRNNIKRLPPTIQHCELLDTVRLKENRLLPWYLTRGLLEPKTSKSDGVDWKYAFTHMFHYKRPREATVALLVLNKRRALGKLHKDVVKHMLAPMLYETRDDDKWHVK